MSGQATHEKFASMAQEAEARGLICVFVTITLPRRFHPLRRGVPNANYAGESPSDGQRWLLSMWAKVRTGMARRGLRTYGMRMVEPHRDGMPHWHVMMFMQRDDYLLAKSIIRRYAREGAEECLFEERHLCGSSTAIHYAKHFAKVGLEGKAWSATWGIRLNSLFGAADELGAAK